MMPKYGKPSSLQQAQALVSSTCEKVAGLETVALGDGMGRCLAHDIVAPIDLPVYDVAAMDGYAIRSADLGTGRRAEFKIVGEVAAGHPTRLPIGPGETMRIFTGAVIPPGADRVVPQERCNRIADRVTIAEPAKGKPHIRLSGEDVLAGQTVLQAGTRIGPAQRALLAALHVDTVPVLRRLHVAILSTGDEVTEAGTEPAHGGIVDTNRPMLKSWLESFGCTVEDLGIVPDSAELLLERLVDVASRADLIVASGGASVGPADHLARLIQQRGCLEFWKLNMRPGKPVGFGDIDDCPILALPGNPFAAAVAFHLIGRVLIAQLSGDDGVRPETLHLPLAHPVVKKADVLQVLAGKLLHVAPGVTQVMPLHAQGSASLLAAAAARGLVLVPEGKERFGTGDLVAFVLL